jgi:hypothetical protein
MSKRAFDKIKAGLDSAKAYLDRRTSAVIVCTLNWPTFEKWVRKPAVGHR